MPIYKRCPRCGKRIPSGSRCSCKDRRYREEDKYTKDSREKRFYKTSAWTAVRQSVMDRCNGLDLYSLCVLGQVECGEVVHHIIELKEDWERRLDLDNLIYLTEQNHQRIHEAMRKSPEAKREIQALLSTLYARYQMATSVKYGSGEKFPLG